MFWLLWQSIDANWLSNVQRYSHAIIFVYNASLTMLALLIKKEKKKLVQNNIFCPFQLS